MDVTNHLPLDHIPEVSPWGSGDATTTGTPGLLRLILVSVGLAALIVTVVTVHIWTRAKGGAKRMRKNLSPLLSNITSHMLQEKTGEP
ncbi:hypothetical protein KUCAC02_016628 [Chaenocephalus aceratus]|nr:hypothetical protein KUCAC02_016628 [Chaenocephalus aceratus]